MPAHAEQVDRGPDLALLPACEPVEAPVMTPACRLPTAAWFSESV
jgi:hypothetical protein